jgi:hypothetical protein
MAASGRASLASVSSGIVPRVIGAVRLRRETYAEIMPDPAASRQAVLVVFAATVSYGVEQLAFRGPAGAVLLAVAVPVLWLATAALAYVFGTRLFATGTPPEFAAFARAQAFAYAPNLLAVVGASPVLRDVGLFVSNASALWSLVCAVAATRYAFGMSRRRASATFLIAYFVVGTPYAAISLYIFLHR